MFKLTFGLMQIFQGISLIIKVSSINNINNVFTCLFMILMIAHIDPCTCLLIYPTYNCSFCVLIYRSYFLNYTKNVIPKFQVLALNTMVGNQAEMIQSLPSNDCLHCT